MGQKSNKSAAERTLTIPGVSTRETHDAAQLPPPKGVTLLVLRRDGYRTVHLAKGQTMLTMVAPLCGDEDVTIGEDYKDHHIDNTGRPPARVCNACGAEASRIGGIIRP